MQSEPLDPRVLEALGPAREAFHSVVGVTVEQARGSLAAQHADQSQEAAELGRFADGRIDAGRFATLLAKRRTLDEIALQRMRDAFDVLARIAHEAGRPFSVQVEPGTSLRDTAANALARIGRAFGAARVFEMAQSGRYREDDHAGWLEEFPFQLWNRSERAVAPPLVLIVNGRDLHAEGLAEFLDGSIKILLVVRGDVPRAPLVRLIAPRVCVVQARDPAELDRFAAYGGPAVAALASDEFACFRHDPEAGDKPWERMTVTHVPDGPAPAVGGRSAAQQRDELAQLAAYAPPPVPATPEPVAAAVPAATATAPPTDSDPVDRLAAWLLQHADLSDEVG